jgi:hypothetical protein
MALILSRHNWLRTSASASRKETQSFSPYHSRYGASGRTEYPSRDEADAGDESGLGENRFENAHESNDLWKFWHGDLLLQSALSTPSKRIAMPFFNLFRMIPIAKFRKVHQKSIEKIM